MLKDMLTKKYIKSDVVAVDWQDAIKHAGELLVENGNATNEYTQAMIDVVNELGPYIVLCPGVAFAHARPECGTIKPGISLILLKNPIEFGNENNDPVKVVFAFAGKDHTSHMEMLQDISSLLQDDNSLEKLINSTTMDEVIELLNKEL